MIFGPLELPWRFNFLDYELNRGGAGAGLTENIVQLLLNALELRERKGGGGGGENADFFANAKKQILRSAVDVLVMAKGKVSVGDIYRQIITAPTSLEQVRSEDWRKNSFAIQSLVEADQREKNPVRRDDLRLAADYWMIEFPCMSDRTRTSITSTITGTIDVLQRGILRELLCTTTTITPEDIAAGKIVLNALNIREYGEVGALAQVILKYSLQRAIERRDVSVSPRPVTIQVDEFQNFTTSYDAVFAATCRSARVSFGLLTQNLPILYAALGGGDKAKVEIDALLGNTNLRIFCANGCATTNKAAAEMIGRCRQYTVNGHNSGGQDDVFDTLTGRRSAHSSAGFSEIFEFEVQPQVFATRIEGFEDHLGVIFFFQVNRNYLQGTLESLQGRLNAIFQLCFCRKGLLALISHKKVSNLIAEVEISFNHSRSWIILPSIFLACERMFFLNGGTTSQAHHVNELAAIKLRRPHLELIDFWIGHHSLVLRKTVKFLCQILASLGPAEVPERGEKDLESGEPLLAVNNLPLLNVR